MGTTSYIFVSTDSDAKNITLSCRYFQKDIIVKRSRESQIETRKRLSQYFSEKNI